MRGQLEEKSWDRRNSYSFLLWDNGEEREAFPRPPELSVADLSSILGQLELGGSEMMIKANLQGPPSGASAAQFWRALRACDHVTFKDVRCLGQTQVSLIQAVTRALHGGARWTHLKRKEKKMHGATWPEMPQEGSGAPSAPCPRPSSSSIAAP